MYLFIYLFIFIIVGECQVFFIQAQVQEGQQNKDFWSQEGCVVLRLALTQVAKKSGGKPSKTENKT